MGIVQVLIQQQKLCVSLTLTRSAKDTTKGNSVRMTRFFTSVLDKGGPSSSININVKLLTASSKLQCILSVVIKFIIKKFED